MKCDGEEADDQDTLLMSPTEKASSPTEDEAPTVQLSEDAPTVIMTEETRENIDLQKKLLECKEEIQELKEDIKEDIEEELKQELQED